MNGVRVYEAENCTCIKRSNLAKSIGRVGHPPKSSYEIELGSILFLTLVTSSPRVYMGRVHDREDDRHFHNTHVPE